MRCFKHIVRSATRTLCTESHSSFRGFPMASRDVGEASFVQDRRSSLVRRDAHTCVWAATEPSFVRTNRKDAHTCVGLQENHHSLELIEGTHTRVFRQQRWYRSFVRNNRRDAHTCFRLQQWQRSFVRTNRRDAHTCFRLQQWHHSFVRNTTRDGLTCFRLQQWHR